MKMNETAVIVIDSHLLADPISHLLTEKGRIVILHVQGKIFRPKKSVVRWKEQIVFAWLAGRTIIGVDLFLKRAAAVGRSHIITDPAVANEGRIQVGAVSPDPIFPGIEGGLCRPNPIRG